MHIEKIVIYSPAGKLETIDFYTGKLNIITGDSRTGKSSLINIIRYCLGSDSPHAPVGPIQTDIAWFGLVGNAGGTSFFVGRPAVAPNKTSTTAMLQIGVDEPPAFEQLQNNATARSVQDYIGGLIGIEDNLNVPPEGQTRNALSARLTHSLFYCFQAQGEIANPDILFHRQTREYIPQAIKDTLPYFIGAQGIDDLRRRQELDGLKRELRRAQQSLQRAESEIENGLASGSSLLNEARDAGLYAETEELETPQELQRVLGAIVGSPAPVGLQPTDNDEFDRLRDMRGRLLRDVRDIDDQLRALDDFSSATSSYSSELQEQSRRLASIGLIPAEEDDSAECVVCGQTLGQHGAPTYEHIENALGRVNRRLQLSSRDTPRVEGTRANLVRARREVSDRLRETESSLQALVDTDDLSRQRSREINAQSYVRGRISRYLDELGSINNEQLKARQARVDRLTEQIEQLEQALDADSIRSRVTSILSIISRQLTAYASRLQLEHADEGLRLDINRLTVVADTDQGPAYMNTGEIGSGMNWVGYHLSAYLALHQYFVSRSRPVPRFVVFDQPSQAFFPREREVGGEMSELADTDRENTRRLFRLLHDVSAELSGELQIVVLDHADFDDPWFQDAVVERWREGEEREALVPTGWLGQGIPEARA